MTSRAVPPAASTIRSLVYAGGTSLTLSPDGRRYALGVGRNQFAIGEVGTGKVLVRLGGAGAAAKGVAWRPDGRGLLLVASLPETIVHQISAPTLAMAWTPEAGRLRGLLLGADVTVTSDRADVLHVQGLNAEQIGTVA